MLACYCVTAIYSRFSGLHIHFHCSSGNIRLLESVVSMIFQKVGIRYSGYFATLSTKHLRKCSAAIQWSLMSCITILVHALARSHCVFYDKLIPLVLQGLQTEILVKPTHF